MEPSATLSDEAKKRLRELVPLIAGKTLKIEVRGHASRRPLPADSPYHDAWQLSFARCEAVMKYLEEQGIPADRMRLSQAGGNEPFSNRLEPEFRARNPRVEVFLTNEMARNEPAAAADAAGHTIAEIECHAS